MKRFQGFVWCCGMTALLFSLGGCVSVGNSPTPRFYTLDSTGSGQDKSGKTFVIPEGTVIGVGPVALPVYLTRPQIVTRDKNGMLIFAQFDRWGELLDAAMARLINEELARAFPQATVESYPWNFLFSVRYQVIVELLMWDARLDDDLTVVLQWSLLDLDSKDVLLTKRSTFNQPIRPHSYKGLTDALSVVMTSLGGQITEALVATAGKQKV